MTAGAGSIRRLQESDLVIRDGKIIKNRWGSIGEKMPIADGFYRLEPVPEKDAPSVTMNVKQVFALAAEMPMNVDWAKVTISWWNRFGTVLVEIGTGDDQRSVVLHPDGRVFNWTGSLADLAEEVLSTI